MNSQLRDLKIKRGRLEMLDNVRAEIDKQEADYIAFKIELANLQIMRDGCLDPKEWGQYQELILQLFESRTEAHYIH